MAEPPRVSRMAACKGASASYAYGDTHWRWRILGVLIMMHGQRSEVENWPEKHAAVMYESVAQSE